MAVQRRQVQVAVGDAMRAKKEVETEKANEKMMSVGEDDGMKDAKK